MKRIISTLFGIACSWIATGQEYFPKTGVLDERPGLYAFTNAIIWQDYKTKVENATLVIENGKVVSVGSQVSLPKGATVIDCKGKTIYPGFIDPYTNYGLPEVKTGGGGFGGTPQYETKSKGLVSWNEAIKAEYEAILDFSLDSKTAENLRKSGFTTVLSFRRDGIIRGSGFIANLGNQSVAKEVVMPNSSLHFSFTKGSSRQAYPNSIMGMVALIRQTLYDAQWYQTSGNKEIVNESLAAINSGKNLPWIFEATSDKQRVILADKVGDEFGIQFIIKGNGDEYQRIQEVKKTGAPLIIPVNFPDVYSVDDPLATLDIAYTDLKHWELAPRNPYYLEKEGIEFAFTTDGLKKPETFLTQIRKAVENGLSEATALKALTYTPAKLLRQEKNLGSLNAGTYANFLITNQSIFEKESEILQVWVGGNVFELAPMNEKSIAGKYKLTVEDKSYDLELSGTGNKTKGKIKLTDTTSIDVTVKMDKEMVSLSFQTKDSNVPLRLTGWMNGTSIKGTGLNTQEKWISFSAEYQDKVTEKEKKEEKKEKKEATYGEILYPFQAYGWTKAPATENVVFRKATVWTMEGKEKETETDVWIKDGKIAAVGKDLVATGATEIDARGKHITPGIIDEHSHAALSGVNEGSHANTAEVRMQDAIDAEDIDIYRQLAGGVVAAQLLHGSANPIGGQSAIVKFRWGLTPDQMLIKGADGFIKFALGENVKQANWGGETIRFPQTRMGVETIMMDGFTRAKEYEAEWKKYNAIPAKERAKFTMPRRDLKLEALAQILSSQRFITCHSYVQSEINMMMKVAESFNFKLNTFTHILEGYKVADKMAQHGVGGSTFSDWWAYKYEVKDAIPYNAALMTQAGVTVAINSDDAEMARRLNQEAGKSLKYGEMDEYEAMKMITINPAKLLHLDKTMGSLLKGKDADIVVWNAHPLSIYASPDMTYVDGIRYFDKTKDNEARHAIQQERVRIVEKMKAAKSSGAPSQNYKAKEKHHWHCEDIMEVSND